MMNSVTPNISNVSSIDRSEYVEDVFSAVGVNERATDAFHAERSANKDTASDDESVSRRSVQVQDKLQKHECNSANKECPRNHLGEVEEAVGTKVCLKREDQAFVKAECFIDRQKAEHCRQCNPVFPPAILLVERNCCNNGKQRRGDEQQNG